MRFLTAFLALFSLVPATASGQTTVIQDSFTDTAGTDLPAHTPDVKPTGSAWATPTGMNPLEVNASGQCVATVNNTDNDALIDSEAADGTLKAIVNCGTASNAITLWFRSNADLTDALGVECFKGSSQLNLITYVSGTRTVLESVTLTWTDNTDFDVQIDYDGEDITVTVNSVIRGIWTSSENLTSTYVGIEIERTTSGPQYVDDLEFYSPDPVNTHDDFYLNLLQRFGP